MRSLAARVTGSPADYAAEIGNSAVVVGLANDPVASRKLTREVKLALDAGASTDAVAGLIETAVASAADIPAQPRTHAHLHPGEKVMLDLTSAGAIATIVAVVSKNDSAGTTSDAQPPPTATPTPTLTPTPTPTPTWMGPAGGFTPLHHDLTNTLLIQLVGRKRVPVASPDHDPALSNRRHGSSGIGDLEAAAARGDLALKGMRIFVVDLAPGVALFPPVGRSYQIRALDFSVSAAHTNFVWPNDPPPGYPD